MIPEYYDCCWFVDLNIRRDVQIETAVDIAVKLGFLEANRKASACFPSRFKRFYFRFSFFVNT